MESLEQRVKKLENHIIGSSTKPAGRTICDQLEQVSKLYRNNIDEKYLRFLELNSKFQNVVSQLEEDDISGLAKANHILAKEEDLINYHKSMELMSEKADEVLDIEKWPQLDEKKLDRLEKITREQHVKAMAIDKRTEELIEIYNDIIGSFKVNSALWNEKLEAYENEERRLED